MKPKFDTFLKQTLFSASLLCISLLTIQVYPTQAVAAEAGVELYQYEVTPNLARPEVKVKDFGSRYYFGENLYRLGDFSMGIEGGIKARPIAPIKKTDVRLRGLDIMGVASYDFSPSLQIYGKLGLSYEKLSVSMPNDTSHNYETTRNTSPEVKIGGKFKVNKLGIGISVNKTLFDMNTKERSYKPHKNNQKVYSAFTVSWDF